MQKQQRPSMGQPLKIVTTESRELCNDDHYGKDHNNGHRETSQRSDDQIPMNRIDLCSIDCFHVNYSLKATRKMQIKLLNFGVSNVEISKKTFVDLYLFGISAFRN